MSGAINPHGQGTEYNWNTAECNFWWQRPCDRRGTWHLPGLRATRFRVRTDVPRLRIAGPSAARQPCLDNPSGEVRRRLRWAVTCDREAIKLGAESCRWHGRNKLLSSAKKTTGWWALKPRGAGGEGWGGGWEPRVWWGASQQPCQPAASPQPAHQLHRMSMHPWVQFRLGLGTFSGHAPPLIFPRGPCPLDMF